MKMNFHRQILQFQLQQDSCRVSLNRLTLATSRHDQARNPQPHGTECKGYDHEDEDEDEDEA